MTGYYSAGGSSFTSAGPTRIMDTRYGTGVARRPVGAGASLSLQVTGTNGVPASGVTAVVLNVTVTGPTANSYRGIRAEYLGSVEGRLGEHVVRMAAGDRCLVPHVVIDDVPFAPAVPFSPDELQAFQDPDRLGDRCRADLEPPDQLG